MSNQETKKTKTTTTKVVPKTKAIEKAHYLHAMGQGMRAFDSEQGGSL